jgi:hypothetical protein
MCDEVPMAPAGDLGAERVLSQWAVALHVEDTQAYPARQNLEDGARISTGVVLEYDDWHVSSESYEASLQNLDLCAFDVQLDQRRYVPLRQSLVERLNLNLEFLERLVATVRNVEAAARVCPDDSEESSSAGRGCECGFSDLDLRERFAEPSGTVRERLEGYVVPKGCITNHMPEKISSTGTDVDTIRIRGNRQRKDETQCIVVVHGAPRLARGDGALHQPQLLLQTHSFGNSEDLTTTGDHEVERIIDAPPW